MRRAVQRLAVVAAAAAAATAQVACVGEGTGEVKGDVHVHPCHERDNFDQPAYNMDPSFFAGEPIEDFNQDATPQNRLEIRVQASSGNIGGVVTSLDNGDGIDTLFVSISDVREVKLRQGLPIALQPIHVIGVTDVVPSPVRAALQLMGSCPFSTANYLPADTSDPGMTPAYTSTITFTKFGQDLGGAMPAADFKVDFGDTIEATFDMTLIDERFRLGLSPQAAAWGHITGNFSFELRRGAAGQTFP
jgi:hypothetical protein